MEGIQNFKEEGETNPEDILGRQGKIEGAELNIKEMFSQKMEASGVIRRVKERGVENPNNR